MGLRRLHEVVGDPSSSDTAAVTASRYLVELAIGPGGLPGLTEPLDPGSTCGACGHHERAEEERGTALNAIFDRLDVIKDRLTAPVPGSAAVSPDAVAEQEPPGR